MSVFFDYTVMLRNSYQLAHAALALEAGATTDTGSDGTGDDLFIDDICPPWTSPILATPTDGQIYYAILNLGHTGTTTLIEYDLKVNWLYAPDSWKLQIKGSGGAWASLHEEATGATDRKWGTYTTPVVLPAEVQVLVTDAAGGVQLAVNAVSGGIFAYYIVFRCVGTV